MIMKRYEMFIPIFIGVAVIFGALYVLRKDASIKRDFLESTLKSQVRSVVYEDKTNCIYFTNNERWCLTLTLTDMEMAKYNGKTFDEFIFPGDSVIKLKNKEWLQIKPADGREPFKIW